MGPPTPPYVSLRPKVGPDTCSRRCHLAAGCLTQIRLASCSISLSLLHLTPFADCPSQQTCRTSLLVNLLWLVPILQSLFAEIASHLPISCCLAFPWSWPGSLKGSAKWGGYKGGPGELVGYPQRGAARRGCTYSTAPSQPNVCQAYKSLHHPPPWPQASGSDEFWAEKTNGKGGKPMAGPDENPVLYLGGLPW